MSYKVFKGAILDSLIKKSGINFKSFPLLNLLQDNEKIIHRSLPRFVHEDINLSSSEGNEKLIQAEWKKESIFTNVRLDTNEPIIEKNFDFIVDKVKKDFETKVLELISKLELYLFGSEKGDNKTLISGLKDIVSKNSDRGFYANIDRKSTPQWKNKSVQANKAGGFSDLDTTIFDGTNTTEKNIISRVEKAISILGDDKNKVILASNDFYAMMHRSIYKYDVPKNSPTSLYLGNGEVYINGIHCIKVGEKYIEPKTLYVLDISTLELVYDNINKEYLTKIIEENKFYEKNKPLPMFSVPYIETDSAWLIRSENNIYPSYHIGADVCFTCNNPSLNMVMYDN